MNTSLSSSVSSTRGPSVHKAFYRAMLQSVIASVTVFSIADQNPVFFVLTGIGILFAWLVSVRPQHPAPRAIINTILLLVVIIAGVEMLRIGAGVSAFAVFVALLLIVKLLDLRVPRDDGQILVLSVAILVAAILTSNNLMTGLLMLIASVLLMRAVVLFQIHSVMAITSLSPRSIGRMARVDIRSMLLGTGFLCALIGSVIFVVLPRNIGVQAFGQWGAGRSVSGFSDSVELGRPGFISQSSTPVLDLTMTDRNGLDIGSDNQPAVYLRGAILTEYASGRWNPSPVMRSPLANRALLMVSNTALSPQGSDELAGWDKQFNITMRTSSDGPVYLFAPWKTVEFRVGEQPMRVGLDFERGIFLKDGIGGRLEYAVRSKNIEFDEIDYELQAQRDEIIPTEIDPEIAQLAADILVQAGIDPSPETRPISEDSAAIRLIENHLRSRYTYSLDAQPVPNGEDATRWFLFDRKAGHCEYYASALALMSRSIGVPARVITGYVCSEFNSVTGQYVVRESNAHAWIEAEIAPGQWRTFDGTPRADFHSIHEPDPSLWRSLADLYESVEFLWVRTVVGYNSTSRQNIMGSTSTDFGLSKLSDTLLNRLAAGRGRLIGRGAVVAAIVFASSMLIGVLLLRNKEIVRGVLDWTRARISRLWRRLFDQAQPETDPRLGRLELLVNQRLNQLGIAKPAWSPLKSHLKNHQIELEQAPESTQEALFEASGLIYIQLFSRETVPRCEEQIDHLETLLRRSEKS
jgi:protein-glutamine gamma-glutamyltransferase